MRDPNLVPIDSEVSLGKQIAALGALLVETHFQLIANLKFESYPPIDAVKKGRVAEPELNLSLPRKSSKR
jgi:hypothetical protein